MESKKTAIIVTRILISIIIEHQDDSMLYEILDKAVIMELYPVTFPPVSF